MERVFLMRYFGIVLTLCLFLVTACGTDTALPTLAPSPNPDGNPTSEAGSGFDPDLGNSDTPTAEPTPTRESGANVGNDDAQSGGGELGFVGNVTGVSELTITGRGLYFCHPNSTPAHIEIHSSLATENTIFFSLPMNTTTGTHNLVGANGGNTGSDSTVIVTLGIQEVYASDVQGTITLDALPTQLGDMVSGSFNFAIQNNTGNQSINVRGEFDFSTDDSMTVCG